MRKKSHTGICHICGIEGELSFEHIPPENAINSERAKVYTGEEIMKKYRGKKYRYTNLQQGMGKYTLCERCNNNSGSWYAKDYSNIAKSVAFYLHNNKPLTHGSIVEFNFSGFPALPFIKQVITMFCSSLPYEEVEHLGFGKLLLDKENNSVNSGLFDIRMYLTPIKTGQISSGIVRVCIKNDTNGIDCANIVDLSAYPFGFILNLSPEIELKYGSSINYLLQYTYLEKLNTILALPYLERLNEDVPLPMVFKPLP